MRQREEEPGKCMGPTVARRKRKGALYTVSRNERASRLLISVEFSRNNHFAVPIIFNLLIALRINNDVTFFVKIFTVISRGILFSF